MVHDIIMNQHTRPTAIMPAGAIDCHMHVFGEPDRYPLAARRSYTPLPASLEDYLAMSETVGLARNVFVQASAYGTDNRCMLDAMRRRGAACRGVAVIGTNTSDAQLVEMHTLGVRGVRLNFVSAGVTDAAAAAGELERIIARVAPLRWHVQIFASLAVLRALQEVLAASPVTIVIDHMGLPSANRGLTQQGFDTVLRLLGTGHCWVKVSGTYRVSNSRNGEYSDATPFAAALIRANPSRIVWGSDWPHTGQHNRSPDPAAPTIHFRKLNDGTLLDLLAGATTPAIFKRILVDNPTMLYEF
jgi:predicted TIM-barrel fold metal-dependent hydrolase